MKGSSKFIKFCVLILNVSFISNITFGIDESYLKNQFLSPKTSMNSVVNVNAPLGVPTYESLNFEVDIKDNFVAMREIFNVKVKNGKVDDATRLYKTAEDLKWVIDNGGSPITWGHIGRTKGVDLIDLDSPDGKVILNTLADILKKDGIEINYCEGVVTSEGIFPEKANFQKGKVNILNNIRIVNHPKKGGKNYFKEDGFAKFFTKILSKAKGIKTFICGAYGDIGSEDPSSNISFLRLFKNVVWGPVIVPEIENTANIKDISLVHFGGSKLEKSDTLLNIFNIMKPGGTIILGSAVAAYLSTNSEGIKLLENLRQLDKVNILNEGELPKEGMYNIAVPKTIASDIEIDGEIKNIHADISENSTKWFENIIATLSPSDRILLNGTMGFVEKGFTAPTQKIIEALAKKVNDGSIIFTVGGDGPKNFKKYSNLSKEVYEKNVITFTGGGVPLKYATDPTALVIAEAMKKRNEELKYLNQEKEIPLQYFLIEKVFSGIFGEGLNFGKPLITKSVDTYDEKTNKHLAKLDVKDDSSAYVVEVPLGTAKTNHEEMTLPIIIPKDQIPNDLKNEDNPTELGKLAAKYLKTKLQNTGITVIDEKKLPSDFSEVTAYDAVIYHPESQLAMKKEDGSLVLLTSLLVKKDHKGFMDWTNKLAENSNIILPDDEEIIKNLHENSLWMDIPITNNNEAIAFLSKNIWTLFEVFQNGESDIKNKAKNKLKELLNNISPYDLLTVNMEWSDEAQIIIPTGSKENPFNKQMGEYKKQINSIAMLASNLYFLVAPVYDTLNKKSMVLDDVDLQNQVIDFYYNISKFFDAESKKMNDASIYEPIREYIGRYANKLNQALVTSNQVIDINSGNLEEIKGLVTSEEYATLDKLQKSFPNGWAWDILMLQRVLSQESFSKLFRTVKAFKRMRAEDKPKVAIIGSGQIGKVLLAMKVADDINDIIKFEPEYVGRYTLHTTSLNGENEFERLENAVEKVKNMLINDNITEGKINIADKGNIDELIKNGTIIFEKNDTAKDVIQDDKNKENKLKLAFPVNIKIKQDDGSYKLVGVVYVLPTKLYNSESARLFKTNQDNNPKPVIIDGYRFEYIIDATEGGIHVGGSEEYAKEFKTTTPDIWTTLCNFNIKSEFLKTLEGTLDEFIRWLEVKNILMSERGIEKLKFIKAQVLKKFNPEGGSYHYVGASTLYAWGKIGNIMLGSPCSCSTNGATAYNIGYSSLYGFGILPIYQIGNTKHIDTGGSAKSKEYGAVQLQATGAAKAVGRNLPHISPDYRAVRISAELMVEQMKQKIVGGSFFYFLNVNPYYIPGKVVSSWMKRIADEEPELLKVFDGKEQTWKNELVGIKTGSILYDGMRKVFDENMTGEIVAYDNEVSYTERMNQGLNLMGLLENRQEDVLKIERILNNNNANTYLMDKSA